MNISEADAPFYSRLQHILLYHRILLRDEARNIPFYEALKNCVPAEKSVLDIGSGSGVWAIAAARFGAKKVTAIEADAALIPLIQAHARENGAADKIEIIFGDSTQINLSQKYDVIISETIGNQGFDENIVRTMIDARRRFLADGGVLIPQKLALVAAPVHLAEDFDLPCGLPFTTDYIKNLTLNLTSYLTNKNAAEFLSETCKLLEVDMREVETEPDFANLSGRWDLEDVSRANAVVLWAKSVLVDGIELDIWKTLSWSPVVLRFTPFTTKTGKLELNLNANPKQYHWTLRAEGEKPQSYAPFFAYSKLKFDAGK